MIGYWMMTTSGDACENGLYKDNEQVVSILTLMRDGYDVYQMDGYTQKKLAWIASRYF